MMPITQLPSANILRHYGRFLSDFVTVFNIPRSYTKTNLLLIRELGVVFGGYFIGYYALVLDLSITAANLPRTAEYPHQNSTSKTVRQSMTNLARKSESMGRRPPLLLISNLMR
jgi:hypothetical protein